MMRLQWVEFAMGIGTRVEIENESAVVIEPPVGIARASRCTAVGRRFE